MASSRGHLSRNTAVFAAGTMLSRVLGLVRDMAITALVPGPSRDAFLVAFRFPNMLRDLVGEGASNAAFVPVLSETLERDSDAAFRELASALLSALLLILGALTVAGVLFMPEIFRVFQVLGAFTQAEGPANAHVALMESLTRWTFPYIFFIGLTVFAMGPLFIKGHYLTPSWSPALLNVTLILACFAFRGWFPDPAYALVFGVWLGGVSQLFVQYVALYRYTGVWRPNFHLRHPGIRQALWLLAPVLLGQAAGEVNKLVDTLFAARLADGSVTALFYANRLVQLPLSVFGIAISAAVLPSISKAAARKDLEEVRDTLLQGLRHCLFLVGPALVALLLLSRPIVSLLFQRGAFDLNDSDRTAAALVYYAVGLLCFAWVKVTVAGFYAQQDTKTPVAVATASMCLNIALNFAFVGPMGFRGLALATTIAYSANFLLLYYLLSRRLGPLWDKDFLFAVTRIALACAGAGIALLVSHRLAAARLTEETLLSRALLAGIPLTLCGVTYLALCAVLRVRELRVFMALARRRP